MDTKADNGIVATLGAEMSSGVFATVLDSWVLVVSASVVSKVEGIMETYCSHYTD